MGDRGDSLQDITPRGGLFYVQFLKEFYFLKKIKPGNIVLDVGCGTATLLEKIVRNGVKCFYIGIDVSFPSLKKREHLLAKGSFKLIQGDLTKDLRFDDNFFNVVICSEVIEHFKEEAGKHLLKEIYRVMKPNGCFLITTTTSPSDRPLAGHLREYTLPDLESLLMKSNFSIQQKFGLLPNKNIQFSPIERQCLQDLSKFYPTTFLKCLFSLLHPEECRSYLIEATKSL
jgi:ubiquinone/menaquinone biosynthesis C-methylase UbiE